MSEQTTPKKENRMGTQPIPGLLMSMAVPMMLSMMVQALYNVVDSIFVAKLSEDALTAVSLGFPMQNLLIAFATGLGVGINALLSRSLGEKNQRMVNESARQGFFLEMSAPKSNPYDSPVTPKVSASRRPSSTSAFLQKALVGIHPQLRHTPPASAFSTIATRLPHCAARIAAT